MVAESLASKYIEQLDVASNVSRVKGQQYKKYNWDCGARQTGTVGKRKHVTDKFFSVTT